MGFIGPNNNFPVFQPALPQVVSQILVPLVEAALAEAVAQQFTENGTAVLAPFAGYETSLPANQVGKLLKNLLQLPDDIAQLLALLATEENGDPKALLKLLAENPKIPLDELQKVLQDQVKNGEGKLMKLLQSAQTDKTGGSKSIGDLINAVSQLSARISASPTQALNTAIALYLPFLPMNGPQQFHLYFEELEGDPESGQQDGQFQLVLFIETISLGQFKIVIGLNDRTRLNMIIEHDPAAAQVIDEIEGQIRAGVAGENVPPPDIEFIQREVSVLKTKQLEERAPLGNAGTPGKPSVGIHPMGGVSVVALHAAYLITRVVLEIDNRHAVLVKREVESRGA